MTLDTIFGKIKIKFWKKTKKIGKYLLLANMDQNNVISK